MSTLDAMIEEVLKGSVGKAQKLPNMGTPHVVYKTVAVDDFVLTLQPSCRSKRTGKPIPGINKGYTRGEPSQLRLLVNPTDLEVESVKAEQGIAALKVCIPETTTLTEIKRTLHTRTQGKEWIVRTADFAGWDLRVKHRRLVYQRAKCDHCHGYYVHSYKGYCLFCDVRDNWHPCEYCDTAIEGEYRFCYSHSKEAYSEGLPTKHSGRYETVGTRRVWHYTVISPEMRQWFEWRRRLREGSNTGSVGQPTLPQKPKGVDTDEVDALIAEMEKILKE